jgi:hypothetical protein
MKMPSGNHKFSEGIFMSLVLYKTIPEGLILFRLLCLTPLPGRCEFSTVISSLWPVEFPLLVFLPGDFAGGELFLAKLPFLQEAVQEVITKAESHMDFRNKISDPDAEKMKQIANAINQNFK